MIETSISPQTLSLKDRIVDVRNRTVAKLAQYKGILKAATLTAAALLTTASSCDGTSANVGDINAGVGGAETSGCMVTIVANPANIRSSAQVLDANGMPSYWNVIGSAAGGVSYPRIGVNYDGQGANAANASGTNTWFAIPFNGETGWVNETVASSNCE